MTDPNYTEQARALLAPTPPDHVEVIARLLAERDDLRKALEITKGDRDKWAREARDRNSSLAAAEQVNARQADELKSLRSEVRVYDQLLADQCDRAKAEADKLRARIAELEAVNARQAEELAAVKATAAKLRSEAGALANQVDADDREIDALKARIAELEARPVLTEDALHAAVNAGHGSWVALHGITSWPGTIEIARRAFARLGAVTLPAQDRAEELIAAYVDEYAERYEAAGNPPHMDRWSEVSAVRRKLAVDTMTAVLTKIGAPATAPAPAPADVFAGVSEDELIRLFYVVGTDGVDHGDRYERIDASERNGIRAVLDALRVKLIAPVDPEEVAKRLRDHAREIGLHPQREPVDYLESLAHLIAVAFTRVGIPVTPSKDGAQ